MKLSELRLYWGGRPYWMQKLDDKADFKVKNRGVWCAYMRLLVAIRDLDKALEAPKKGCQCNAHGHGD